MEELIKKIEAEFTSFKQNATQLVNKGNKAAGVRSRRASSNLDKLFKEWRAVSVKAE